MEHLSFNNSSGESLTGLFFSAKSPKTLLVLHGLLHDKTLDGWIQPIAALANTCGFNVFSFDFRGSGESADTRLTIKSEVDDLSAALQFLYANGTKEVVLFGHSLGGLIALHSQDAHISSMILLAPVTTAQPHPEYLFPDELIAQLSTNGYLDAPAESGKRSFVRIDQRFFEELKQLDQKTLLSKTLCPVLLIQGTDDRLISIENAKNAISYLPEGSLLELVKGTDHLFTGRLETILSLTKNWLQPSENSIRNF